LPKLARIGGELHLVWTDVQGAQPMLRGAVLSPQ